MLAIITEFTSVSFSVEAVQWSLRNSQNKGRPKQSYQLSSSFGYIASQPLDVDFLMGLALCVYLDTFKASAPLLQFLLLVSSADHLLFLN